MGKTETLVPAKIKRIQLTDQGEILKIDTDETKTGLLGWHEVCGGEIGPFVVSNTYSVLLCKSCGLRVYYPTCATLKELQDYLNKQLRVHVGGLAIDA